MTKTLSRRYGLLLNLILTLCMTLLALIHLLYYVMTKRLMYGVEDDALRPRGGPVTESCDA